jgi:uncharacterized membrane protein YkgB
MNKLIELLASSQSQLLTPYGLFPTPQYGFPYLSGAGRLVIKDIIMLGAGLICASDNAKQLVALKT